MAKEFSKDNYINIPGFAITDLKLSGNELIVFSIIHGFSQDGQSEFNGSLSYLASALNSSRQTVINVLKSLTEKQLIAKKETTINNIKFNSYSYNLTGSQNFIPLVKNIEKVVKKFDGGSQNFVPNNIYNNTINNKDYNSVYTQNKNFATPTQENQIDLCNLINEVENENTSLNNQKEKRKKVAPKKENRFIKPNIDEIKDYFFEIGAENYNLESEKFFDYYESNGWHVGKSKMKDWKATARNWNRNTKKFNNGQQTNNTSTATGNAYEWKPNLQEQLESAAEHLRKINSF